MSARGIGAFIQGGFQGYQFGEDVRDRRRGRTRQDELDRIAEEQRAIDNRRNATRDGYLAQDQQYVVSEREREAADRRRREQIAEDADQATRDAMDAERAGTAPTVPEAPIEGADGTSSVQGGPGDDTLTPADVADAAMVDAIRKRIEPRLTAEQQTAISANAPANPNPPSAGGVPAPIPQPRGAMRQEPDPRYTSRFADGAAPSPGAPVARRSEADIRQAFDRSFDPRGPAGAPSSTVRGARRFGSPEPLVPTDGIRPPPRDTQPPARRIEPLLSAAQREAVSSMNPANPNPPSAGRRDTPPPPARGVGRTHGPEPLVPPSQDQNRPVVRPGMTQEPIVNPMRSVGGALPVTAVMPPKATRGAIQSPADAAADVPEQLERSGTPSGDSMAYALTGPAGGPPPRPAPPNASPEKQREADEEAQTFDESTSEAYIRHYREVGAPLAAAEFLRLGLTTEAEQYLTWIDTQTAREGMQIWGQAAAAAARGDADTFATHVMDLYDNEDFFPDGMTVDRENSTFLTDPETGDIYGAQVAFVNAQGETFIQTFEGLNELFEDILNMTAPERAFELQLAREQSRPAAAQAAAEEAKSQAAAQRERVSKIVQGFVDNPLSGWMEMTPEQQQAAVQQQMELEDRLSGGARDQGPSGQGQVVPVPDWRG
jgi:hypothetical protein